MITIRDTTSPNQSSNDFYSTEVTYANKDLILDPALPRKMDLQCPKCHTDGPVYYQPSEESMSLSFVCKTTGCVFMGSLEEFKKVPAQ